MMHRSGPYKPMLTLSPRASSPRADLKCPQCERMPCHRRPHLRPPLTLRLAPGSRDSSTATRSLTPAWSSCRYGGRTSVSIGPDRRSRAVQTRSWPGAPGLPHDRLAGQGTGLAQVLSQLGGAGAELVAGEAAAGQDLLTQQRCQCQQERLVVLAGGRDQAVARTCTSLSPAVRSSRAARRPILKSLPDRA